MTARVPLKKLITERILLFDSSSVVTPTDFLNLGNRSAIDKVLQRLVKNHVLRRIDRGLYDQPRINSLTGQENAPDYLKVIDAVARRDQVRLLLDGMTCANELGLTNAVSGQIIVHTDGRLKPITLGKLVIRFKLTSPSKLYWANRPALRVVQALHWLHAVLQTNEEIDQELVQSKLIQLLQTPIQGKIICNDLLEGLHTVPAWMQQWIRTLLTQVK